MTPARCVYRYFRNLYNSNPSFSATSEQALIACSDFLSPDSFDIFKDIFPARCREKKTAHRGRLSCLFGYYRRVTTGITMGERLVVLKR